MLSPKQFDSSYDEACNYTKWSYDTLILKYRNLFITWIEQFLDTVVPLYRHEYRSWLINPPKSNETFNGLKEKILDYINSKLPSAITSLNIDVIPFHDGIYMPTRYPKYYA
jgi:hypothetical protein